MKIITAEDILRLLLRSATQFVTGAWQLLGIGKKIIDIKETKR